VDWSGGQVPALDAMELRDADLGHATVRQLIVELARVEDGIRSAEGRPRKTRARLAEHERAILAELHNRTPTWQG
jgi:hypothetical protein